MSSHPSKRPTWTLAGSLQAVLLGLASGGVCLAAASPQRRCALTAPFHPYRRATHVWPRAEAVSFLWHFPAGFPGSSLATTLPCDVRTFLEGEPPRLLGLLAHSSAARTSPRSTCRSPKGALRTKRSSASLRRRARGCEPRGCELAPSRRSQAAVARGRAHGSSA